MLFVLAVIILARKLLFSPGQVGEDAVSRRLRRLPKDKYFVINDLIIRRKNGRTTQIDHVVVSPYGIFVIETKNISGHVYGGEYSPTWTRYWKGYARGGYYTEDTLTFDNPVLQNGAHVKALYEELRQYDIRYVPIIAFSPEAELKVNVQGVDVIYWTEIRDVIRSYKEPMVSVETAKEIYERLLLLNIRDKKARQQHAIDAQANKEKYYSEH